jgi:hypothetical protein
MEKCACEGCCAVPGYHNPDDPEEKEFDIGGENRVRGHIDHSKKMIIHDGIDELAEMCVIEEDGVPADARLIGKFVQSEEFPMMFMWEWGHALQIEDALTIEELSQVPWTNNLDSTIDYDCKVGMIITYVFAIIENIRRHYKKPIYGNDIENGAEFYLGK